MSTIRILDMRVALYARVSMALKQNPENQLIELRKWAAGAQHEVIGEFVDETSSKDTRPQKEAVLKKLRLGQIDGVAFYALDRWGRTMSELVLELEEFSKSEKSLISLKEGIDLSTAAGRLMANVLAAMANFERDRIRERTLLGLARAKAQGRRLGRHPNDCKCGRCKPGKKKRKVQEKPKTPPVNPTPIYTQTEEDNKRSFKDRLKGGTDNNG